MARPAQGTGSVPTVSALCQLYRHSFTAYTSWTHEAHLTNTFTQQVTLTDTCCSRHKLRLLQQPLSHKSLVFSSTAAKLTLDTVTTNSSIIPFILTHASTYCKYL